MSNMYYSNTISINKRQHPIPKPVEVNYESGNRFNKFNIKPTHTRRFVSETFKLTDRNKMVPGSVSPIMMQSGINEVDRIKEMSRTHEKLESY
jgi:hypothetical protein